MELTEPAAEAGGADEAAPGLADEGGAGKARRFGRRRISSTSSSISAPAGGGAPMLIGRNRTPAAGGELGFLVGDEREGTEHRREPHTWCGSTSLAAQPGPSADC